MKQTFSANLKWLLLAPIALTLIAAYFVGFGSLTSRTLSFARPLIGPSEQTEEPTLSFDPGSQEPLSAESAAIAISLEKTELCGTCGGGKAFTFAVRDKLQGTVKQFTIGNQTAHVDAILLAGPSRAVVLGSINGTLRSVNIVNTDTGSVIDYVHCLYPSMSKDGRFLAYVKSVSKFSAPQDWSYVYVVYDLKALPSQNRLMHNESSDVGFEDQENVGTPIYPIWNFEKRAYISSISGESQANLLASRTLFWINENVLAFVDRSNNVNSLVIVDLSAGVANAQIKLKPLETTAIIDTKLCKESTGAPENLISVSDIRFTSERADCVRLTFEPIELCLKRSTLDIPLP